MSSFLTVPCIFPSSQSPKRGFPSRCQILFVGLVVVATIACHTNTSRADQVVYDNGDFNVNNTPYNNPGPTDMASHCKRRIRSLWIMP